MSAASRTSDHSLVVVAGRWKICWDPQSSAWIWMKGSKFRQASVGRQSKSSDVGWSCLFRLKGHTSIINILVPESELAELKVRPQIRNHHEES